VVTAVTVACPPTADELITTALARVDEALELLDKPLTCARVHALRQDLTVVKIALLTPPVRPEEMS
jgi:hypothetical protein